MKLEELLQGVEAANPWTAEKISKALGAEFEYSTSQNGDFKHYDDDRGPADLRLLIFVMKKICFLAAYAYGQMQKQIKRTG